MKSRKCVISDYIYGADWLVVRGGELQKAIDAYAKRNNIASWKVEGNRQYGHFGAYRPFKNGVIWLSSKAGAGAIAHEVTHATAYLFEGLECKLNENTEEVFAYYVEWLTRSIVEKLWQRD